MIDKITGKRVVVDKDAPAHWVAGSIPGLAWGCGDFRDGKRREFVAKYPTAQDVGVLVPVRGRFSPLPRGSPGRHVPGMLSVMDPMDPTVTALERAFALAKSGEYTSVVNIKKQLTREGYSVAAVTGPTLSRQLLALIRAARGRDPA
jgi:hypothetical protein